MAKDSTSEIIETYYKQHPEEAANIGGSLLREKRKERQEQAIMNAWVSSGQGASPYKTHFQLKFLDAVGMSWWKWELLLAILDGVCYVLHFPGIVHGAVYIIMVAILIKRMA